MYCLAKKGLRVGLSPQRITRWGVPGGSRGIKHVLPCKERVKTALVPFGVGAGGGTPPGAAVPPALWLITAAAAYIKHWLALGSAWVDIQELLRLLAAHRVPG